MHRNFSFKESKVTSFLECVTPGVFGTMVHYCGCRKHRLSFSWGIVIRADGRARARRAVVEDHDVIRKAGGKRAQPRGDEAEARGMHNSVHR